MQIHSLGRMMDLNNYIQFHRFANFKIILCMYFDSLKKSMVIYKLKHLVFPPKTLFRHLTSIPYFYMWKA